MIITAIRRQRAGLYLILTDEGLEITLDTPTLEAADDLAVGLDLEEERLLELQAQSDYNRARVRSLELVAKKEYCRAELIAKLSQQYSEEAAELAADEMERLGFVDDERYAEMYADAAFRLKKHGRRRVAADLAQKGIDRALADSTARALAPDPGEALDELLCGRLGRDLETEAGCRRVINTLVRYGYEMGDILAALRRKVDEEEDGEE